MNETGPEVYREIVIRARPETIFGFLTEASQLLKWMGVEATLTPVPGGTFRLSPNGRDVIRGEFVEVVPYTKVVFTWGYERPGEGRPPPGSTTVEITLEAREDGTLVRLRHGGLAGATRARHAAGWLHYLSRLEVACRGGDPGPDSLAAPGIVHG
ncbi:MAG: SRPBCC family protein [Burkholderiales bacterium]